MAKGFNRVFKQPIRKPFATPLSGEWCAPAGRVGRARRFRAIPLSNMEARRNTKIGRALGYVYLPRGGRTPAWWPGPAFDATVFGLVVVLGIGLLL